MMRLVCALSCVTVAFAAEATDHELLNSVLWTQTAVEHDAVVRGAYRNARERLDRLLKEKDQTAALEQTGSYRKLPPAIILDIDETVLDNSPMQARLVLEHTDWSPASWDKWIAECAETALPGAVEFTQYAHSRGVSVFFVTNRDSKHEEATRCVMKRLGFPLSAVKGPLTDTILCRGEKQEWGADKGSRRAQIAQHYRVLMLFGDDLGDFLSNVRTSVSARRELAAKYGERWGREWVMLPNPMYGSWETALSGHDFRIQRPAKMQMKYETLQTKGVTP